MTQRTVSAVFEDREQANDGVEGLVAAGFDRSAISLLMSSDGRARHFPGDPEAIEEGTGVGATLGALVGALGAVAGIAGGVIVAGPLGALFAAAASGAVGGGLVGALAGLGVPSAKAEAFEARVEDGGVAVAVETGTLDAARRAEAVLAAAGGPSARHTLFTTKPRP